MHPEEVTKSTSARTEGERGVQVRPTGPERLSAQVVTCEAA